MGQMWRVDVHRTVKMLCRKVEYVSPPSPHSVRLATEFVSSDLFLLSSFCSYNHLCKTESPPLPLPAPSWVWLQISEMTFPTAVGTIFLVDCLIIVKIPMKHLYSHSVDAAPYVFEIMKYSKSVSEYSLVPCI